jgi:hypothetical protein
MRVTGLDGSAYKASKPEEITLMYHTNEHITKHKIGLLNLAQALGNVSKACQVMELSRDTFYRYKQAVKHAPGGLHTTTTDNPVIWVNPPTAPNRA